MAENPWPKAAGAWHGQCRGKEQSSPPEGLDHPPVWPPAPHSPELCPTCPAGVSGSEPVGPGAQLTYGKEGCKQRTRGGWGRTKATCVFCWCPMQPRGCPPQGPGDLPTERQKAVTTCPPPFCVPPPVGPWPPSQPHSQPRVRPFHSDCGPDTAGEPQGLRHGPERAAWPVRGKEALPVSVPIQGVERTWRTEGRGR